MLYFVLLALPALVVAKISIDVTWSPDDINIAYYGNQIDVISKTEQNIFNLEENKLIEATTTYLGRRPDDAYIRSPTPWGDLYRTYGWEQVKRILAPVHSNFISSTEQRVLLASEEYQNELAESTLANFSMERTIENNVSTIWRNNQLTTDELIDYEVNLDRDLTIAYSSKLGEARTVSKTTELGSRVEMLMQPGQTVNAELSAKLNKVLVQVDFEATLSGQVAVSYDRGYSGHRFWSFEVQGLMEAAQLDNRVRSAAVLEISYYSEPRVTIVDSDTKDKLYEYQL